MISKFLILIISITISHTLTETNFHFYDPFRRIVNKLEKSIQQKLPKSRKSEPSIRYVPPPEIKLSIRGIVNSESNPTAIVEYQREVLFISEGFKNKDFFVTSIGNDEIKLINNMSRRTEVKSFQNFQSERFDG